MSHSARRRGLVIAGSSVVAGFTLMAPAYAAASGHSAAPAATSAVPAVPAATSATSAVPAVTSAAAGRRTPSGALVRPGGVSHLVGPRTVRPGARNTATTSTNWSGYAATGRFGAFTSVSSSWVEPTARCTSGDQYSSFWVGLDGFSSYSVEQTGSAVDCIGSTPEYYSWYEMYPAYPVNYSNPVRPGDHFTGSVTVTRGSTFTLTLSDTTQRWSHTVTRTLFGAARSSAEVIAEAPCCTADNGILPLTDFGTVSFSGSTANGLPLSRFSPVGINMVSQYDVPEDTVSALSGGSFSATWLSSGNGPRGGSRR